MRLYDYGIEFDLCRHRTEELRSKYEQEIRSFVKHWSSLLKQINEKTPVSQDSEQALSLARYVEEGHHALLYFNRCYGTGHVPSATGLQSLEHSFVRLRRASSALQVKKIERRSSNSCGVAYFDIGNNARRSV